jgi:hypothetical protein
MIPFFRLLLGLLLTGSAGWVDAIGYVRLGGLYPSFMSGNTTQLGFALSHYEWTLVGIAATILGLFFLGSFCGGLTASASVRLASSRGSGLGSRPPRDRDGPRLPIRARTRGRSAALRRHGGPECRHSGAAAHSWRGDIRDRHPVQSRPRTRESSRWPCWCSVVSSAPILDVFRRRCRRRRSGQRPMGHSGPVGSARGRRRDGDGRDPCPAPN